MVKLVGISESNRELPYPLATVSLLTERTQNYAISSLERLVLVYLRPNQTKPILKPRQNVHTRFPINRI